MGGRRVDGGPAVSCAGTSFRVAGREIRQRNLWSDVEPLLGEAI